MSDYLDEVRYAVESLVPLLWHEQDEEERLHREFHRLDAATAHGYERAQAIAVNADDVEDVALATGIQWETYFGADKERHEIGGALSALRARLEARRFSVDSLSGALLQHVKQGLSLVHGGLSAAPAGRAVGGQSLCVVVWQARNQAMHWDEGKLSQAVIACFSQLETDFGAEFANCNTKNLAFRVIRALDWRTPHAVIDDLKLLA